MFERYGLGIVLGAQIVYENGVWVPSRFLELRISAAAVAYHRGKVPYVIVSGGHNVGVRYDGSTVFGQPDFSFGSLALAQNFPSEAEVMRRILREEYNISRDHIFVESLSATTAENVEFLKTILMRRPAFQAVQKIGLITQLYHMPAALKAFRDGGLVVDLKCLHFFHTP